MLLPRLTTILRIGPRKTRPNPSTRLHGRALTLRLPDIADWWEWRDVRGKSRAYLTPWEPEWGAEVLTHKFYTNYVRRSWREWRQDKGYAFLIFPKGCDGTHKPLGGITITDVSRGDLDYATLGYWMGEDYAGRGIMTEAAALVRDFAFNVLQLDRLDATCMPHNEPSKKILERTGFVECGFAFRYLQINGKMEDHLLYRMMREPIGQ